MGMENLGAVCNFEYPQPADDSPEAIAAAQRYDGYYNRFFLSGIFRKEYPADVMEALAPHMPQGWENDFDLIGEPLDWCGLNYYTRQLIAPAEGPWPSLKTVEGPLPKTAMEWEIYPEGLRHFLKRTHEDYTHGLPLYVTENGMASYDTLENGAVYDPARMDFLDAHLAKVREAIAEGVPVAGYYTWSLMDNYEWSLGYDKRFGLIHVDFDTLARTPKASYHALARALSR
jgi:beta-glucosidase